MNILITGSNGFIGKNLLAKLNNGENRIKVLVRQIPSVSKKDIEEIPVNYENIDSLRGKNIFNDIDVIYHVAGVTKSHNWEGFYKGNILPAENILKVITEENIKLSRFVLISSASAAGPAFSLERPVTENDIERPIDLYGKSKYDAERIVSSYGDRVPFTIIRPGGVFGPEDVDFFNLYKMTKSGFNVYPGVKNKYISLVFVTDLINGIINASLSPNAVNKKYFLCDDKPLMWKEIHETIFKVAGKKFIEINLPFGLVYAASHIGSAFSAITGKQVILNKNKVELSQPDFWISSNEAAKNDFGYIQNYTFEEAARLTFDWYKTNKWL